MHSGWGIVVAVNASADVIDRRRIVVVRETAKGGKMPFHHAEKLGLPGAEKYILGYTDDCESLAKKEIGRLLEELRSRDWGIVKAALALASGKPLPDLAKILAAHPLIHTAEGELFRNVVQRACESFAIPVVGYPERKLKESAQEILGQDTDILSRLAEVGKTLGPPWTADHKSAALAAFLALKTGRARKASTK